MEVNSKIKKTATRLVGMDAIEDYTERNKKIIKKWIAEDNFPAVLVDGRWESNTELIDQYFKKRIEKSLLHKSVEKEVN